MNDIDTPETGGDGLSIEEAAAAYAKVRATEADTGQSGSADADESEDTELPPSDEDEGGADEDATDEGQADDEDGEEPDTEQGRYVAHNGRVKLPDGSESTVADLIQGNLRDRDYRQKTMTLAEERKASEAQSAAIKASQQQLEDERQYMADLLRSVVPPMPSPSMTDPQSPDFDPVGYSHKRVLHEQWLEHLNHLQNASNEARRQAAEEARQFRSRRADTEFQALVAKVPEFKDQKKVDRFVSDMLALGTGIGFSKEELGQVALDHRFAMIMRLALKGQRAEASAPAAQKKVEGKPPVLRGGKRLNPTEQRGRTASDAFATLRNEGTVEAAAAAWRASKR